MNDKLMLRDDEQQFWDEVFLEGLKRYDNLRPDTVAFVAKGADQCVRLRRARLSADDEVDA